MSGQHTGGAQNSANAGAGASNMLKEGITKIHGLGEAIRGNVNTFADNVTNTDDTRSRAEVDRGANEIRTGKYHGAHTAGVTPNDTAQERAQDPLVGHGAAHTNTNTAAGLGHTGPANTAGATDQYGTRGPTSGTGSSGSTGLSGTVGASDAHGNSGYTGTDGTTGATRYV